MDRRPSTLGRVSEGVCQRAFSSPEAFLYEGTIAAALSTVVLPALRRHITGPRVLDVGAGGGRLAVALSGEFRLVGIDPSWPQVRRFRRRAGGRTAIVRARGESLPFASRSFDTVYSSCVYKHWTTPDVAMRDCARLTRPGGTLITIEIDGDATPAELRQFADHRSLSPLATKTGCEHCGGGPATSHGRT
jgi:ubiquinone/menaquinone biosynthesis C-methylase UbiE